MIAMAAFSLIPASVTNAQAAGGGTAGVFASLEGAWSGEGTLFGRLAAFEMRWQANGDLFVLTFENAMVDSTGARTPVLQAVALYRTNRGSPRGAWEDSRGVRNEIIWTASDSTLTADWSTSQESGRTTYRLTPDGYLHVTDEVMGEQGLRPFGRATYRRVTR
jgi:hypothetical protein